MKVIFLQDVKKQGKAGEVKDVSDGYAWNYLIPNKLAMEATTTKLKEIDEKKAKQARLDAKELAAAEEAKEKLEGKKLILKVKTGDSDRLFGAVTNKEVADELKKQYGVDVDKKKVEWKENIKTLGRYSFVVKLYPKVQAKMTLSVEAE